MGHLKFKINSEYKHMRTGVLEVPHGKIETPNFVPVATKATVKALSSEDMKELNSQILMCNSYHLYLKPGLDVIKKFNGLHKFMNWNGPIMTDSAGFQVFSLGFGMEHFANKIGSYFIEDQKQSKAKIKKMAKVTNKGVWIDSIYTKEKILFTPEKSMRIQEALGSDIMIAFDECTSPYANKKYVSESLERTHKWAKRSLDAHKTKQALFGVIQGSYFKELRIKSAKFISNSDFDGFCIGGSLGKSKAEMHKILEWITKEIDPEKPRHLLGIGVVEDFFNGVERGIDLFDCVGPTRIARAGLVYVSPECGGTVKNKFRIKVTRTEFEMDKKPIDCTCNCKVCQNYSRAYIRHLFKSKEYLAYYLTSYHNLHFVLNLMEQIRESIKTGTFFELKKKWLSNNI